MTLSEAIKTNKKVKRKSKDWAVQWFLPNTGPYNDIVSCDYFVAYEFGEETFITSLDLYADDILDDDWEVLDE